MRTLLVALLPLLLLPACAASPQSGAARSPPDPNITLDALHQAAARAEFDNYFALFADHAVFLGTDATERWTLDEFKAFARPHFAAGKGWTYTLQPGTRSISTSADGRTAWFDELLINTKLGTCRGSGVLTRDSRGSWRIAQYNLSIPVPNDRAREVVDVIRR